MKKIVFGPISSRRFGLSLGLDLSPDKKQCNFDCVYCELNAAKPQEKSLIYPSVDEIIVELLQSIQSGVEFDFITLTANGEPSLYPFLDELIWRLNKLKQDKRLLILSNGSAVLNSKSFNALLKLDVVKFSLDSAIEKTFYRIDRALRTIKVDELIKKFIEFKTQFSGDLIMEVLVVKDLNDTPEEMLALNEAFANIKPLRVDFSTIDRPPAYPVKPVSLEDLVKLSEYITSVPVVIAKHFYSGSKINFSEEEILKMLKLRSQSEFDVEAKFTQVSKRNLQKLLQESKVTMIDLAGVKFYKVKNF
ncbi:radical SAM protein [Campylobacter sp. US33a]|uniref:Radical SAM protein n=1 Tax=Campylobacter sp. CCS1377 TaxID=3158229 RepID=A0AAU7E953_9BACT|nr:radical SAM protein [Campylobacter sp. US33a]MCW1360243.1 radical SAM protein [Campylobacter jejuni]TEY02720.1 radical SAM protein [Campylobacter sp. US33a]